MPKKLEIISGTKYNRLTILGETTPEIRYNRDLKTPLRRVECVCECGNFITARISSLINESTKSCGCFKNENILFKRVTHGSSRHVLYHTWANIIQRCENVNSPKYKNYGMRGIFVCTEWRNDFMAFYNWAIANGWQKSLEIDRRDNDDGYTPHNCRIVTRKINCNNTRRCKTFEHNGDKLTLTEICTTLNIDYKTVHQRLFKYNWSFERAINTSTK